MNYKEKLKSDRFRSSTIEGRNFNEEMESDRGRAVNSAAVRRLQQKTQVFPLESNAAVRSRLTHSLEVQQVGRYISKIILKELGKQGIDLSEYSEGFVSAVEVSCLLHDIGNPPFGHFGEEAINLWTKTFLADLINDAFDKEPNCQKFIKDLCNFEGNAQGIRLLHQIQALNLTYTQLACLIKYTRAAYEDKPSSNDKFSYRKKKPGFYLTEEDLYKSIQENLAIEDGARFPLTYIMEAADDISYCIADVDDAIDKGILSIGKLHSEIARIWESFRGKEDIDDTVVDDGYLLKISEKAMEKAKEQKFNSNHAYILTLRTTLVNDLAHYAASRYVENHDLVFSGAFDESLLDGCDKYNLATETLRLLSVDNVFNHAEVENLELKGYAVIYGLLRIYSPLIKLPFSEFKTLAQSNRLKSHPIETRLFHKLSSKHKNTYFSVVSDLYDVESPSNAQRLTEIYHRSRLVIDYISGMTDGFALEEYQNLSASK
ncbi:dGTPase [Photobacterium andalusiense]|uniref:Deoxyguanosinetriphosphate triphosphohydrolase n=1 Tax=Photobacterium andalusiense TaxID=2204296 RepID=A0A1Y6M5T3_9GAMM|nr:dGTPase [Photobacterium andalusiense]SMY31947.1 Deoxyguanosinetriphosphate triphosphohydrolase [Photobacterium andalusiense]